MPKLDAPQPVYVDSRVGSKDMILPLQQRRVPVELTTLLFGDLAIVGNGADGPVMIGVERKKIRDLLNSLTTGRLSGHQLPGLVEHYAHRWLLVEGIYRESVDGLIEVPCGGRDWETIRFQWKALEAYLVTLTMRGGLHVQRTYSQAESAGWIEALWRWWTGKDWDEHRSHLALHQPEDAAVWFKPNLVHRWAAQLPGIDEKAAMVARVFKTPLEMALAGETEWRTIPGIGKVTAQRAVKAIQEGKE
jgi:ERCC4-type nuclease